MSSLMPLGDYHSHQYTHTMQLSSFLIIDPVLLHTNLLSQESLAWVRYLTDLYFFSSVIRQLEQQAHLNKLRELAAAANNTEWKTENK